jgi:putative protease
LEQAGKTGGTEFEIEFTRAEIDEDIFVPISEINELRRRCVEEFRDALLQSFRREPVSHEAGRRNVRPTELPTVGANCVRPHTFVLSRTEKPHPRQQLNLLVANQAQLRASIMPGVHAIYSEIREDIAEQANLCHAHGVKLYIALPHIVRAQDSDRLRRTIAEAEAADGFLVRTNGQLEMLAGTTKELALDYTFNIANSETLAFYKSRANVKFVALSVELSLDEAPDDADAELIVYGRLPLMTTVQCPVGNYAAGRTSAGWHCAKAKRSGGYCLRDRKGYMLPIVTDCESCVAFIMNANKIYALNRMDEISRAAAGYVRFNFTDEDEAYVSRLVRGYIEGTASDIGLPDEERATYGHLFGKPLPSSRA